MSVLFSVYTMQSVTLHSPAKINLMLSIHGRREDGFHALTSLVAALAFGDELRVSINENGADHLRCDDSNVPTGDANLILRAANAFRALVGGGAYFDFDLEKRIPMGAGLGGGSSNAAVALRAMNQLLGSPLANAQLLDLAAGLGSDCPFFINPQPVKMTGRGDVLAPISEARAAALRGRRILLFRPDFAINTTWAYRRLASAIPSAYEPEAVARSRLEAYARSGELADVLYNSFEESIGEKYLAIPCLHDQLRTAGHSCLMSGSGSCCFALANDAEEARAIRRQCLSAWGSEIFFIETSVL